MTEKQKLGDRVRRVEPSRDKNGRYISYYKKLENGEYVPFCEYSRHRGKILDDRGCLERRCKDYKKLVNGDDQLKLYIPDLGYFCID